MTGAEWPEPNQLVTPCQTLKVISSITTAVKERDEQKRMRDMPGLHPNGTPIKKRKQMSPVNKFDRSEMTKNIAPSEDLDLINIEETLVDVLAEERNLKQSSDEEESQTSTTFVA